MPCYRLAAVSALLATTGALTTTTTPKQRLRSRLQPSQDELLCDPATKEPLAVKAQYFNGVTKKTYSWPATHVPASASSISRRRNARGRRARSPTNCPNRSSETAAQRVQEDTFRNPPCRSCTKGLARLQAERLPGRGRRVRGGRGAVRRRAEQRGRGVVLACSDRPLRRPGAKHPDTRVIARTTPSMLVEQKAAGRGRPERQLLVDVAQLPFNANH